MRPLAARRATIVAGTFIVVLGLWLGHTLEYMRVWGLHGLGTVLLGSVHAYMLPAACVIAAAGFTFARGLWRAWADLGRRLDSGRALLHASLRGHRVAPPAPVAAEPSFASGVLAAWPLLAVLQIALYLLQENIETAAAGLPAPGLGAVTGVHALAPLVHAAVALVLVTIASALLRLFHRRQRALRALRAVTLALTARLARSGIAPRPGYTIAVQGLLPGLRLRRRPPPAALPV